MRTFNVHCDCIASSPFSGVMLLATETELKVF